MSRITITNVFLSNNDAMIDFFNLTTRELYITLGNMLGLHGFIGFGAVELYI